MFIANKPCTFMGKSFLIGEVVPDELVDVKAVKRLKQMRVIFEAGEQKKAVVATAGNQLFTVPVITKDGTLPVELTAEALTVLFTVLQETADNAAELVEAQENKDLLLCIHALDKRKTVQNIAKERATALN